MIDYLTLMLMSMSGGLLALGVFFICCSKNAEPQSKAPWAAAFGAAGLVAFVCGLHMALTWPLSGPYNSLFGESSVMFGVLFLAIALATAKGWSWGPIGLYGLPLALSAILLGVLVMMFKLTMRPEMTMVGFITTGLGGLVAIAASSRLKSRTLSLIAGGLLIAAALLWALVGGMAFWGHLNSAGFVNYKP